MKITNRLTSTVTTDTFEIEDNGRKFIYIEYLNEKGKVIDSNLRDEYGHEIYDTEFLEQIQNFVEVIPCVQK